MALMALQMPIQVKHIFFRIFQTSYHINGFNQKNYILVTVVHFSVSTIHSVGGWPHMDNL
jgi:hypothetical protein